MHATCVCAHCECECQASGLIQDWGSLEGRIAEAAHCMVPGVETLIVAGGQGEGRVDLGRLSGRGDNYSCFICSL